MKLLYMALRSIYFGLILTLTVGGVILLKEDDSFLSDPFVIQLLSMTKVFLLANAALILGSFFVVLVVVVIELICAKRRKIRKAQTLHNYQKYYIKE